MTEKYIQTSGPLFEAVQQSRIFSDSKIFTDSLPKTDPDLIMQLFEGMLARFVYEHFELPPARSSGFGPKVPLEEHIDKLWKTLTREPDDNLSPFSTQIALPYQYIVPGGRFRESYYWDTYFTAEGLVASGRADLLVSMIKNFADLIDRYGHIPNGNRTYYLSRSQPPVFCCMLQLLEREQGFGAIEPYLSHLEREYHYWMDGEENAKGEPIANKRTVTLKEGVVLNRYWDDRNDPREESYREDVALFRRVPAPFQCNLYRNIRAAAESGWDFSSRWLVRNDDGTWNLESIRTTEIIPVDLNCLLYNVERQLARWLRQEYYNARAQQRRVAIQEYLWDQAEGWFFDYCWTEKKRTDVWSLAGVYPLFFRDGEQELASEAQAAHMKAVIEKRFLRDGGVVTTIHETTQQWDAPNGWAPLQWITVQGLLKYQYYELAQEIASRFVRVAQAVYQRTGKMMEKYDVCNPDRPGGGGEYPLQDGFGWTNGVVRAFIRLFPPVDPA
ncbi:MAG: alpha,alpha-trehalase TreF [Chloroflexaceae bacterium]